MPRPPATTTWALSRSTSSVISFTASLSLAFTLPSGTVSSRVSTWAGEPGWGLAKEPERTVAKQGLALASSRSSREPP